MNLRNAIGAFSLLLFSTLFTSCQKDHDLVSSYVIKSVPSLARDGEEATKDKELYSSTSISSPEIIDERLEGTR